MKPVHESKEVRRLTLNAFAVGGGGKVARGQSRHIAGHNKGIQSESFSGSEIETTDTKLAAAWAVKGYLLPRLPLITTN